MTQMVLVTLNEFGDGNRLFLVSPQFIDFAQNLPKAFAPTPGKPTAHSKNTSFPQDVLDSMALVLENQTVDQPFGDDLSLNEPFQITSGSSENDAYMHIMHFVEVFDTHSDMLEYAQNKGIDVDEKNGFWGQIY